MNAEQQFASIAAFVGAAVLAWVFDHYVTDRSLYAVQEEARNAGRGLWADKDPAPPWEWRHMKR